MVGSILDVGLWGGIWGLVVGVHPLARGLRAKGSAVAFANSEKAKWAVAEVSCALVYLAGYRVGIVDVDTCGGNGACACIASDHLDAHAPALAEET